MKKLTLLILMLIPMKGMSQAVIGYTPSELRDKFNNVSWEYGKWGPEGNKNLLVMTWRNNDIIVNYFFNSDNINHMCSITPINQGTLQGMVERYNKRYVIVDTHTWRFYNDGTVFLCELRTLDDGSFFFLWTED